MMTRSGSSHDTRQLAPSIEKLLHYLVSCVKFRTKIVVLAGGKAFFSKIFEAPDTISISPTLWTRIDDCHGAGNCCRVPFDLVYTEYDRQRILDYHHDVAAREFGERSAAQFTMFRDDLLKSLVPLDVIVIQTLGDTRDIQVGMDANLNREWKTRIWVKRNIKPFKLSGVESCPYLLMEKNRYFCGIHPFKPLHCWYPHMTMRTYQRLSKYPSVSIGRLQYGRNHKFGCPVLFRAPASNELYADAEAGSYGRESYFDVQFESDFSKLRWTSMSAESMGFASDDNFTVGIHNHFNAVKEKIRQQLFIGINDLPVNLYASFRNGGK